MKKATFIFLLLILVIGLLGVWNYGSGVFGAFESKDVKGESKNFFEPKEKAKTQVLASFQPQPPLILTYWGPHLHFPVSGGEFSWTKQLEYAVRLRDMGFTHAGFQIADGDYNYDQRISDIRANDLKIAYIFAPFRSLIDQNILDPQFHQSNGQNFKYFDSEGFDPYVCGPGYDCSQEPRVSAIDPAYSGDVWQQELTLMDSMLDRISLNDQDLALYDIEVWGYPWESVDYYYPNTLINSTDRYTGDTLEERQQQYIDYWRVKGIELKNKIENRNPNSQTFFYGEDVPNSINPLSGWMYPGTGDAPSPNIYLLPDLARTNEIINSADLSTSYVWISFSTTYAYGSQITVLWDPKITQKLGYDSRGKVAGFIVYPGPGHHDINSEYFFSHSQALVDGFLNGIDVTLEEMCGDVIDNDGDAIVDEGCPDYECELCQTPEGTLCHREECYAQNEGCYFFALNPIYEDPVGDCRECSGTITCYDYNDGTILSCLEDACGIGNCMISQTGTCIPIPVCSNGIVEQGEQCDDENLILGDGCDENCAIETQPGCGNNVVGTNEECDDGNIITQDGCDNFCRIEPRVFVTSQVFNGAFGNVTGADSKCQEAAQAANLGARWKAWLSNSTQSAAIRLNHSVVAYKKLNGEIVANNLDDLTDASLDAAINIDEFNAAIGEEEGVWTGTQSDGNPATQGNCLNWSSTTETTVYGVVDFTDARWTIRGTTFCNNLNHLYCFEQPSCGQENVGINSQIQRYYDNDIDITQISNYIAEHLECT